ncbi:CBS domain-containing protein [Paenisporosarcina antarctica]|uniref:CBS domain-containing protein n=1 Tax=Paenisporosarcina antarctica TaxID=417367 RepID=A0A4P6ZUI8_9BACL|nr:CBS domain-containing protein [Paenisporosarcina antarctica]QBP40032.1 CBS domain-containing protein [Paenisporosarcina antarctica]
MKIKDIMSRDIVTCTPTDLISEIAQSMRALDIGCMPVVDGPRIIGMITDRDIVTRSVAEDGQRFVKDVMTQDVISVGPESSSEEAAEIMAQHRIRRLPVIKNDSLIGFVALADLSIPSETVHDAAQALHEISKPGHL